MFAHINANGGVGDSPELAEKTICGLESTVLIREGENQTGERISIFPSMTDSISSATFEKKS